MMSELKQALKETAEDLYKAGALSASTKKDIDDLLSSQKEQPTDQAPKKAE